MNSATPMNKLVLILSIGLLSAYQSWGQEYSYSADRVKMLFGLSSPANSSVVMTFTALETEGEEVTGVPRIVDLKTGKSTVFEKLESFPYDANVSWLDNGKQVAFETVDGIYQVTLNNLNPSPAMKVAGRTHGLAFSSSDSRMAYWKMDKGAISLVVRDLPTGRVLQSWKLPFVYGGEASGFEIAFMGEDRVYARTFDKPRSTPLKEFDVSSGKVKALVPDCLSMAGANGAIYYVAGVGRDRSIYRFDQTSTTQITAGLSYTGMRVTGGQWISLYGNKGSAIFDVRRGQLTNLSSCDEVAVIETGTPVYGRGNLLSTNPAICISHLPKPKIH